MGLRVPFALVPFGFNSPIKFIIYNRLIFRYKCKNDLFSFKLHITRICILVTLGQSVMYVNQRRNKNGDTGTTINFASDNCNEFPQETRQDLQTFELLMN